MRDAEHIFRMFSLNLAARTIDACWLKSINGFRIHYRCCLKVFFLKFARF
jgi:hypothetical protein